MSQILDVRPISAAARSAQFADHPGARAPVTYGTACFDATATQLSNLAVSVLLEEAVLTPKPALVDRRGPGAHHDLDLARLKRSARALRDGFGAMARTAAIPMSSLRLRARLGGIGRNMEERMLVAIGGSNAHRGAIWALGLLVAAAARPGSRLTAASLVAAAAALARLPDIGFADCLPSGRRPRHGELANSRYGTSGARGEAQACFPSVIQAGLPMLRAARARGASEERARLDALMAIMARLDDTCLLHRGGYSALQAAKAGATSVLELGGTATPAGWRRLARLHDQLMARWASPGGSADLLAVTLFLDRLESRVASRDTAIGGVRWRH
jgi:triphosphoribosyl-dephospho-CoA synthase